VFRRGRLVAQPLVGGRQLSIRPLPGEGTSRGTGEVGDAAPHIVACQGGHPEVEVSPGVVRLLVEYMLAKSLDLLELVFLQKHLRERQTGRRVVWILLIA